jgi:sterol desaturase/sphingolipid hydroxylase (fatty acid hydroxylase superfamily)
MGELVVRHGAALYALAFFGTLALVAAWEGMAPRRALAFPLRRRWLANLAFGLIDPLLARALLPLAALAAAALAAERGLGLFHWLHAPGWLAAGASLVALDLARYLEHRLLHRVPWLWRLHRMHHSDVDYDFTTALRFHPAEALLSAALATAVVAALGAPVVAVVLDQALFVAAALFAHANGRLPARWEQALRRVLVTPDLHRVHHSAAPDETDSNYASVWSGWDRLFGSDRAAPAAGHEAMRIGLEEFRDPRHQRLAWMLVNPLLSPGAASRR